MRKWFGYTIVLVAVAGGLTACREEPEPPSKEPTRPVKLAKASPRAPARVYLASGVIKAAQRAELSFDRSGMLVDFPVSQGQKVSQGDLLARIDTGDLEIQQQAAEARFGEAESQYQRIRRLYERQAVALADLDRAQSAFEVAQAELKKVNQELDESVLRAPFSGLVAVTLADRYQMVQARQPIVVLHDISSFDIQIYLPETFILEVGREAEVRATATFDHLSGREFPVTFGNVATEASPDTLTYAASFTMAAPEDQPLLPGMSASIRMEVVEPPPGESAACWIPAAAVFSDDGKASAVWVVESEGMRTRRAAVRTGIMREGQIQILEGLRPGDQVAVSGLHSLREGQQVKPYGKQNDE